MSLSDSSLPLARVTTETVGALDCRRVTTAYGEALVSLTGAQLLHYRSGGRDLIWLSEQASFSAGRAVRGGVPICWPWFGVYARNPQAVKDCVGAPEDAPSHGLVREGQWTLADTRIDGGAAELTFEFDATRDLAPWNHPVKLRMIMRFAQSVHLEFSVQNLGEDTLTQSMALHAYFAVSDSRQIRIDGLDGLPYIDTVGGEWVEKQQSGPIAIDAETDRIYTNVDRTIVIRDPGWHRSIHIAAQHSHSAIVWNPWIAKSRTLSDFADDAWQRMVCVETARVMDDAWVIAPGATESVSIALHTEDL